MIKNHNLENEKNHHLENDILFIYSRKNFVFSGLNESSSILNKIKIYLF